MTPTVGALVDHDVDARRLMSVVRMSRELRFVWRMSLFSTLLWGTFVLSVERATPEGSAQWNRVDGDASPGFIVLLVIAGAAFLAQQSLRLAGRPGKVASLVVPPIGPPAQVEATEGAENVQGLLPLLRTNTYIGFGVLTALLVVTLLLVAAVANVLPAWEANHGHGGRVVTIGQNASVDVHPAHLSGRGGVGVINTLVTDDGTANAVGNTPHDGERWTIISDPLGAADSAYLVGGHAYLWAFLLALAVLLLDAGVVATALGRIRAERARRDADDHVPLAQSYATLDTGGRATLVVGRSRVGYKGRIVPPLTIIVGSSPRS